MRPNQISLKSNQQKIDLFFQTTKKLKPSPQNWQISLLGKTLNLYYVVGRGFDSRSWLTFFFSSCMKFNLRDFFACTYLRIIYTCPFMENVLCICPKKNFWFTVVSGYCYSSEYKIKMLLLLRVNPEGYIKLHQPVGFLCHLNYINT